MPRRPRNNAQRAEHDFAGPVHGPRGMVAGAKLRPIRTVKRALTRPDGTVVEVDVPVFPPFRLETEAERLDRERSEKESSGSGR